MIRVLHMIASLEIGGSQAMVMNLYRAIDREKVQFDFIIDHSDDLFYADEIRSMGGKIYVMPTFRGSNVLQIRKAWRTFFKEHPEYKILHSHSRSYASLYLPIAKKHGVKTIIHSHSTSNGKGIAGVAKSVLQYPLRYQADFFMACSKAAGEWLFGKKVCKGSSFSVIKNAIDGRAYIYSDAARKAVRNEWSISEDAFVLGFLARVMPGKNPLFVVDVFEELIKMNPNAVLLFVGDGESLDAVKEAVRRKNLSDHVVFTGARSDVPQLMCAMDSYILPSLWEGLGISLIEAQATGLQCICSENIQNEAIVTDLVKKMNLSQGAAAWAAEIRNMGFHTARENQYDAIRAAGYDIAENAQQMMHFYQSI